uniref:G-protein coupled receptors family 2 profile 2 domain-containing protein n=1 Tax=Amphimedon queenslandica TaxID=400682 RepID=A0A1X7V2F9_AMPQE
MEPNISETTLCNEEYNGTLLVAINSIRTVTAGLSSLICLSSIFLLLFIMCRRGPSGDRDDNTLNNKLILSFLFSALIYSIATIFQWVRLEYDQEDSHYSTACEVVGFLVGYFGWTLMLKSFFLIYHLFHILYKGKPEKSCIDLTPNSCSNIINNVAKMAPGITRLVVYIVISYLFPLLFVWIPLIPGLKGYGSSGYWCWIVVCTSNDDYYKIGYAEQALIWYIPVIIISIVIIALIVTIIIKLVQLEEKVAISCPLLSFPILFLFVNIIAFMNRVVVASRHHPLPTLAILHSLIDPLWGTMAALTLFVYIGAVHRESFKCCRTTSDELVALHTLIDTEDEESEECETQACDGVPIEVHVECSNNST